MLKWETCVLRTIGIPMGTDSAIFWANLYLSKHEYNFMSKLTQEDTTWAKTFYEDVWFIDDLFALHDGEEFTPKNWYKN